MNVVIQTGMQDGFEKTAQFHVLILQLSHAMPKPGVFQPCVLELQAVADSIGDAGL